MAEMFNKEFSKNFNESEVVTAFPPGKHGLLFNCTPEDIREAIGCMRISALGPDCISAKQIKGVAPAIIMPLVVICQQSFYQGKFPSTLKTANVCPIYKRKGDETNPASYRPVSMCSAVGKIFKHIVNKQLCAHLDRNNIISAREHGFVCGHSVTTNLLSADNVIADCVNMETPYDVIIFDMTRAFDKIPHAMLIDVLSSIGLHQKALLWIQSFITG